MAKIKRLKRLVLDRVDLVTAGANPGAFVMIHKFDTDAILSDKTAETLDVQPDEVDKHMADENVETPAEVAKGSRWYLPLADGSRWYLPGEPVQDPDAAMEDGSRWYLPGEPQQDGSRWYLDAGSRWYMKSDQPEDVEKADLRKALNDARAQVAKMELERKQAEFIGKARGYSNLGKADELGALLLAANEHFSAEQYQALERLLKAANAQIETGDLFKQIADGDAAGEPADFDEKLAVLAKAKVDAGQAKTIELAKLQVLNENPGLRLEYKSAR